MRITRQAGHGGDERCSGPRGRPEYASRSRVVRGERAPSIDRYRRGARTRVPSAFEMRPSFRPPPSHRADPAEEPSRNQSVSSLSTHNVRRPLRPRDGSHNIAGEWIPPSPVDELIAQQETRDFRPGCSRSLSREAPPSSSCVILARTSSPRRTSTRYTRCSTPDTRSSAWAPFRNRSQIETRSAANPRQNTSSAPWTGSSRELSIRTSVRGRGR